MHRSRYFFRTSYLVTIAVLALCRLASAMAPSGRDALLAAARKGGASAALVDAQWVAVGSNMAAAGGDATAADRVLQYRYVSSQ